MSIVAGFFVFIFAAVACSVYQASRRLKREAFIRTYAFPQGLLARLA